MSIASLIVGVAAADPSRTAVLTAGTAGLAAGALSMAVGEFVSVSSQRDTEQADLAMERRELAIDPASELVELTRIYERRGLDHSLAVEVAKQLTDHDALGAHLRDELGITEVARPGRCRRPRRPPHRSWSAAASHSSPRSRRRAAPARGPSRSPRSCASPLLGTFGARVGGASKPGVRPSGSRCSARWRWP